MICCLVGKKRFEWEKIRKLRINSSLEEVSKNSIKSYTKENVTINSKSWTIVNFDLSNDFSKINFVISSVVVKSDLKFLVYIPFNRINGTTVMVQIYNNESSSFTADICLLAK